MWPTKITPLHSDEEIVPVIGLDGDASSIDPVNGVEEESLARNTSFAVCKAPFFVPYLYRTRSLTKRSGPASVQKATAVGQKQMGYSSEG